MHSLEQDLQLVRKITGQVVRRYGIEFDDLFSEACLIYLQASRQYNPGRGAWSTFIWVTIQNRLTTLVQRERRELRKKYVTTIMPDLTHFQNPEQQYIMRENWQSILESLSPNARLICEILLLLEDHNMVDQHADKPRKCRGILFRLLRERGWDWDSIWKGFREIRQALRT